MSKPQWPGSDLAAEFHRKFDIVSAKMAADREQTLAEIATLYERSDVRAMLAPDESAEKSKEPVEYNGMDPYTFIQFKDGEEKHYRIDPS